MKFSHPTREEELALIARIRKGDTAAWDEMILRNQGLVKARAERMKGCGGLDFDDLVGHGMLGLIRALEDYDPKKRVKFATYATPWVIQFMQRAIHNTGSLIRVPEYYRWREGSASSTECAKKAKVALGEAIEQARCSQPRPERIAAANDDARKLGRMLGTLPRASASVLKLRYGIEGEEQHTVDACAKRLKLTRRQVRQLETQAMHELARRRA